MSGDATRNAPGAGGAVAEGTGGPAPERRYPQPDPRAFAAALAEVERELAGRRLSADGSPASEDAVRRSTAWARALHAGGWPATPAPGGPVPLCDPAFLDEDGAPIDYSDAPELPAPGWADAAPNPLCGDVWEAELARRVAALARERRRELGLTQLQVAERTGLPQSSVARIEAGRHLPTVATLARLAVVLGLAWRVDVTPRGARVVAEPVAGAATAPGG
jgi:DNA-binding XRE family transcriptional regulator